MCVSSDLILISIAVTVTGNQKRNHDFTKVEAERGLNPELKFLAAMRFLYFPGKSSRFTAT